MTDPVLAPVFAFLKEHHVTSKPLLLAFSGGPDSLALLHALIAYKKKVSAFTFAIAHVNHGWRKESQKEADEIQVLANDLGLSFHLIELNPSTMSGNLEALCRMARYQFFEGLCDEFGYHAVLLGHHADDLAETVLKRVFEGSSLSKLSAMAPYSYMGRSLLWRPLLCVRKQVLLDWLASRGLKGYSDCTNDDERFMRARFRKTLMPSLAKTFGKELIDPLCQVAAESLELREYLQTIALPYLKMLKHSIFGSFLDFTEMMPNTMFEMKALLKSLSYEGEVILSRDILQKMAHHLMVGSANKEFICQGLRLFVDRKRLFIRSKFIPRLGSIMTIEPVEGIYLFGNLKIEVSVSDENQNYQWHRPIGWKGLWEEGVQVYLPFGHYTLAPPEKMEQARLTHLINWWSRNKVPNFLRRSLPVVLQNGRIVHEFLSGAFYQSQSDTVTKQPYLALNIRLPFLG